MTIPRLLVICSLPAGAVLLLTSCGTALPPGVPGAEFAIVTVNNGKAVAVEKQRVSVHQGANPSTPKPPPPQVLDKTHPIIDDWIRNRPGTDREEVLVGFWARDPSKPIFYSALMKVIHSLRVTFSKNA